MIEIVTNVMDLLSFFLVAPDIIGEERIRVLYYIVRLSVRSSEEDAESLVHERPIPLRQPLKILGSAVGASVIVGIAHRLLLELQGTSSPVLAIRLLTWLGLLVAVLMEIMIVISSVMALLVLIIGNRNASRSLLWVGVGFFLCARGLAIWAAVVHAEHFSDLVRIG